MTELERHVMMHSYFPRHIFFLSTHYFSFVHTFHSKCDWILPHFVYTRYVCIKDGLFLFSYYTHTNIGFISHCFIDSKSYVEWEALWQKLWFLSMMPYFKLLVHDHGICQQVHNHQGHYLHYELKYSNEKTRLNF